MWRGMCRYNERELRTRHQGTLGLPHPCIHPNRTRTRAFSIQQALPGPPHANTPCLVLLRNLPASLEPTRPTSDAHCCTPAKWLGRAAPLAPPRCSASSSSFPPPEPSMSVWFQMSRSRWAARTTLQAPLTRWVHPGGCTHKVHGGPSPPTRLPQDPGPPSCPSIQRRAGLGWPAPLSATTTTCLPETVPPVWEGARLGIMEQYQACSSP